MQIEDSMGSLDALELLSQVTKQQVAAGVKSTDPNARVGTETATEANARITQGYKDQPKPELTQEGKAAGATIEFVRTGAGGVGEYKEVFPIGKPIPENRTTASGNTYDVKGNLISGTGTKTATTTTTTKVNPTLARGGSAGGKDDDGKEVFYGSVPGKEMTATYGFYYADGSVVPPSKLVNNAVAAEAANAGSDVGFGPGVSPAQSVYGKTLSGDTGLSVLKEDAPTYGDATYDPKNKIVIVRDFNGTSIYNEKGMLISGRGSVNRIGVAKGSAGLGAQIDINGVGAYGTPEYNRNIANAAKQNLAFAGSSTTNPLVTNTLTTNSLTTKPVAGANYGGSGSKSDPFTVDNKPFTGSLFGSTYNNGVIVDTVAKTADDIAKQGRLDARTEFSNTLKALGLPQNLIDELDNMIKQDYTKSQMYLELQKTPAWKERFPGMAGLAAAGKAVDAGQYISMEKGFLQTLDYYGIDKKLFGTTAELGKQIGNLVSPKAFEDRVALAAQDVEANPDVLAQLNLYFGVDKSAAITYLLNPEIGIDIIKRQARAAEIGAKAAKSAFDFGQTKEGFGVAESFINAAGTMDLQALDVAFQQARGLANTQSSIAATEGADYNDLQAVSAILGKDQAAILDSQRRAARSVAKFSGSSGLGSGSLKQESAI
jgi:hypothetical protein